MNAKNQYRISVPDEEFRKHRRAKKNRKWISSINEDDPWGYYSSPKK